MHGITPGDKLEFTAELKIVCRILSGIKTGTTVVFIVMHSGITHGGVNGTAHPWVRETSVKPELTWFLRPPVTSGVAHPSQCQAQLCGLCAGCTPGLHWLYWLYWGPSASKGWPGPWDWRCWFIHICVPRLAVCSSSPGPCSRASPSLSRDRALCHSALTCHQLSVFDASMTLTGLCIPVQPRTNNNLLSCQQPPLWWCQSWCWSGTSQNQWSCWHWLLRTNPLCSGCLQTLQSCFLNSCWAVWLLAWLVPFPQGCAAPAVHFWGAAIWILHSCPSGLFCCHVQ